LSIETLYIHKKNIGELLNYIHQRSYSSVFFLVDENTERYCLPRLKNLLDGIGTYEILRIKSGEENKTLDNCQLLWKKLLALNADRHSLLINIGGGVITDLGGFTAAIFKRGIDYINIPTSLLAMVDAAVGGKTAVDFSGLKNQIGSFYFPVCVYLDIGFLSTLPIRHLQNAFAEIFKYGLSLDKALWNQSISFKNDLFGISEAIIFRCIELKNSIVQLDVNESGLRKILNFGHTFGHALESCFLAKKGNSLLHGEAVAAGMIMEIMLSVKLHLLKKEDSEEIIINIISFFPKISIDQNDLSSIVNFMKADKKNQSSKVNFTLLKDIGVACYDQFIDLHLIYEVLDEYQRL